MTTAVHAMKTAAPAILGARAVNLPVFTQKLIIQRYVLTELLRSKEILYPLTFYKVLKIPFANVVLFRQKTMRDKYFLKKNISNRYYLVTFVVDSTYL